MPPANATATCNGTSCGFTCTGTTTLCSGACVQTASDPLNCGSCGHSCQGGTCSGGVCQPLSLVSQPISAFNLVNAQLSDTSLYVYISVDPGGSQPYELWQIPINGSGNAVRVCVGIPPFNGNVAIGNGTVFWNQPAASGQGFDVVSSPVVGCNPANPKHLFATPRSFGTDFVADGPFYDPTTSEVIWLEQDNIVVPQKRLMRSAASGGTPRQITMFTYGGDFLPFFFVPAQGTPQRLFWTEGRGTVNVGGVPTAMYALLYVATNLTGSTPILISGPAPGNPLLDGNAVLLANDNNVIWSEIQTGIAPLPNGIAGGGMAPNFVTPPNAVRLGTIDATTLYGTFSSLTPGTIAKCSIASCSPTALVSGQSAATWFLQDASSIYWVNMVLGISPTSADALSATRLAK